MHANKYKIIFRKEAAGWAFLRAGAFMRINIVHYLFQLSISIALNLGKMIILPLVSGPFMFCKVMFANGGWKGNSNNFPLSDCMVLF